MFEAQTENFCKCSSNVSALIFFNCGIMQRLDLSNEVPCGGAFLLKKSAVFSLKISYSFFVNFRVRAN